MAFPSITFRYPTMGVTVEPDISLTILHRLEAATSRLEDMVPHMTEQSAVTNGVSSPDQDPTPKGAKQSEGGITSPAPSAAPLPASIDDFDKMINGELTTFATMSEGIGGLLAEQVSPYELHTVYVRKRSWILADVLMLVYSPLPYFERLLQSASS